MKRKYEVIGIVIDTEKEAEKCSLNCPLCQGHFELV